MQDRDITGWMLIDGFGGHAQAFDTHFQAVAERDRLNAALDEADLEDDDGSRWSIGAILADGRVDTDAAPPTSVEVAQSPYEVVGWVVSCPRGYYSADDAYDDRDEAENIAAEENEILDFNDSPGSRWRVGALLSSGRVTFDC